MAIELCSDCSGTSPRISFSHDLRLSDIVPVEQHPGSIDFDFCVRKSFEQVSSSADELFSDGKILPIEIKKKTFPTKETDESMPPPWALHDDISNKAGRLKKECFKEMKNIVSDEAEEKQSSKSFWRFKRSSSLNCGRGYGRSLCPLPLLSRSLSTGSTPSAKRGTLTKDTSSSSNHKQHKQAFLKSSSHSLSSTSYQKPPLKKNCGSYNSYGSGAFRVNPVLNVPTGNLFGLGSIFFNGKDKNKKK